MRKLDTVAKFQGVLLRQMTLSHYIPSGLTCDNDMSLLALKLTNMTRQTKHMSNFEMAPQGLMLGRDLNVCLKISQRSRGTLPFPEDSMPQD